MVANTTGRIKAAGSRWRIPAAKAVAAKAQRYAKGTNAAASQGAPVQPNPADPAKPNTNNGAAKCRGNAACG